jgi:hypothetical protein
MKVADHRLTIVNLLKRDLRIVRETLLRFVRQHKRLRFLRGCHLGTMLSIHFRFCESSTLWIIVSRAPVIKGLTALGPRSHSYLDERIGIMAFSETGVKGKRVYAHSNNLP